MPKAGRELFDHSHQVGAALVLQTEFRSQSPGALLNLFIRDMPQHIGPRDKVNDEQMKGLQLSDTASPSPDFTAKIVGHFLRKLYTDMLEDEFPERLQPLIEKLDAQEQANRQWVRR
ncbi:hypothetical protein [Microvirga lotononidis]|uniref:hypothetical protein n=1 Tax=Microvirga lotononidis TaxID=864069 RepID=UPI0018A878FF|nr:hypothetical protein [Microvirga lotononidis]WQO30364.1 hypothetical protein U0023_29340 [Microvirga lotononidis]